jgi:hypothetical protein
LDERSNRIEIIGYRSYPKTQRFKWDTAPSGRWIKYYRQSHSEISNLLTDPCAIRISWHILKRALVAVRIRTKIRPTPLRRINQRSRLYRITMNTQDMHEMASIRLSRQQ